MLGRAQSLAELTSGIIYRQVETGPCPDSPNIGAHIFFFTESGVPLQMSTVRRYFIDSCQNVSMNITNGFMDPMNHGSYFRPKITRREFTHLSKDGKPSNVSMFISHYIAEVCSRL